MARVKGKKDGGARDRPTYSVEYSMHLMALLLGKPTPARTAEEKPFGIERRLDTRLHLRPRVAHLFWRTRRDLQCDHERRIGVGRTRAFAGVGSNKYCDRIRAWRTCGRFWDAYSRQDAGPDQRIPGELRMTMMLLPSEWSPPLPQAALRLPWLPLPPSRRATRSAGQAL